MSRRMRGRRRLRGRGADLLTDVVPGEADEVEDDVDVPLVVSGVLLR